MILRKMKFFAEWLERSYDGYTDGSTWNGWECPRFEFEVAEQLAKDMGGYYDEENDEFVFTDPDFDDERFGSTVVNEITLYPIGAWCWIWTEDEDEIRDC